MDRFGVKIKGIVIHDDKLLLVKKWYDDRIDEPYQWEFLDDFLQFGETPDSSALRIIQEGTGIEAKQSSFTYTWMYEMGDTQNIGIAFLCNVDTDVVILSEDLSDYAWVTPDEVCNYIHNEHIVNDLKRVHII